MFVFKCDFVTYLKFRNEICVELYFLHFTYFFSWYRNDINHICGIHIEFLQIKKLKKNNYKINCS